jgi:hypothetical protein
MLFSRGAMWGPSVDASGGIRHAKGVQKTTFFFLPVQRYLNLI